MNNDAMFAGTPVDPTTIEALRAELDNATTRMGQNYEAYMQAQARIRRIEEVLREQLKAFVVEEQIEKDEADSLMERLGFDRLIWTRRFTVTIEAEVEFEEYGIEHAIRSDFDVENLDIVLGSETSRGTLTTVVSVEEQEV